MRGKAKMNQEPKFTTSHCGKKLGSRGKGGQPSDSTVRARQEASGGQGRDPRAWEQGMEDSSPLTEGTFPSWGEEWVLTQWGTCSVLPTPREPDSDVGRLYLGKLKAHWSAFMRECAQPSCELHLELCGVTTHETVLAQL